MKKKVLLIDESLTVQKVVALTLDKSVYSVWYAKSRAEAMQLIGESLPDLILVSDQVKDITIASFPRELESWVGRLQPVPPIILVTSQDSTEHRQYNAILKKPFSPRELQNLVSAQVGGPTSSVGNERGGQQSDDQLDDVRLEKKFNESFADESALAKQTLGKQTYSRQQNNDQEFQRGDLPYDLWDSDGSSHATGAHLVTERSARVDKEVPSNPEESSIQGSGLWKVPSPGEQKRHLPEGNAMQGQTVEASINLEAKLEEKLKQQNLAEIVDKVLSRIVPPIVEKLVQERLDKLLREQEQQFAELKS